MRVLLHPGDNYGCGSHRLIWPGRVLAELGHDVIIETHAQRRLTMRLLPHIRTEAQKLTEREAVEAVELPDGVDVIVMQRPSHKLLAESVHVMRRQGVTVVIDIDDDLSSIHPNNLAYLELRPDRHRIESRRMYGDLTAQARRADVAIKEKTAPYPHSYANVQRACDDASMVVVSTSALLRRYARHGRGRVIHNYLADHYFGHERVDSTDIGWPAVLFSHPDDPKAVGNALARVLAETGASFSVFGEPDENVAKAFGLRQPVPTRGLIELTDWPAAIAQLGIGICPLADSTFNRSKSWLKPLELCAAGVPWVASPRVEYRRLHERGAGVLAEKPADWYRSLGALVRSQHFRDELSGRGREVAEGLRLRDHAEEHADAWAAAYRLDREMAPA